MHLFFFFLMLAKLKIQILKMYLDLFQPKSEGRFGVSLKASNKGPLHSLLVS